MHEPGSGIWRVAVTKRGDVYINNAGPAANEIHIALHASGKFHFKLGTAPRYELEPPWTDPNGLICGPCILFFRFERTLPPIPATGKTDLVHWLGWPDSAHLLVVRTYYSDPGVEVRTEHHEALIAGPLDVVLFHKPMRFHLLSEHRPMTDEEKAGTRRRPEHLQFDRGRPDGLDLIRVSRTALGPSTIILEPFTVGTKPPGKPPDIGSA